jgi:hypothetical protein
MKRTFVIIGIMIILFGTFLITPLSAISTEENNGGFGHRILIVICGTLDVHIAEKELYGFGIIVYTAGETNFFERYTINYRGLPLIFKGLGLSFFCIYKPAEN